MSRTYFFWDPLSDNILQERDEGGAVTAEYTTEPGLYGNLISQNRGGAESQYHFDPQGSTLALTDDNQNVTDTYAYTAYGEVTEHAGSTVNLFRFLGCLGYYFDSPAVGYHVRTRDYLPLISRWESLDPVFEMAHYVYCANSPLSMADPSGEVVIPLPKFPIPDIPFPRPPLPFPLPKLPRPRLPRLPKPRLPKIVISYKCGSWKHIHDVFATVNLIRCRCGDAKESSVSLSINLSASFGGLTNIYEEAFEISGSVEAGGTVTLTGSLVCNLPGTGPRVIEKRGLWELDFDYRYCTRTVRINGRLAFSYSVPEVYNVTLLFDDQIVKDNMKKCCP